VIAPAGFVGPGHMRMWSGGSAASGGPGTTGTIGGGFPAEQGTGSPAPAGNSQA
jgi:hypothetical protein